MHTNRIKILAVDDRPENLLALEELIKANDVEVIKAHSGTEALSRLLDQHVALILMDVQMPDMDGFEVAELIRGREETRDIPIIFVTAHDEGSAASFRGYESGAVDFLHKPLKPEIVRSKVRVFITLEKQRLSLQQTIEELKEVNERMTVLKEEAEAANEAKSAFIANVSHEVRTPMSAILGFAETLTDNTLTPDERKSNIATIINNGHRLLGIINDILDVSKAESGKISVHKSNCYLAETVYGIHRVLFAKSKALDVDMKFTNLNAIPEVIETDAKRLEQVLINMLANAVKFSEGGQVTLALSYDESTRRLSFEVTDTGIGISKEAVGRIFEPFGQADDSSSRRYGGTGLGLVLSKRLCQLLGGDLSLKESQVGVGSTFVATIEAQIPDQFKQARIRDLAARIDNYPGHHGRVLDLEQPAEQAKKPLQGRHVLLVDDSEDNRRLVEFMLRDYKLDLDMAVNGKEALTKSLHKSYDLVLMDIQMPEMDGYEAMEELRNRGFTRPIVALTAHAMNEERKRCLEAGFDSYLSKPFNKSSLVNTILKMLSY